jgi:hypothetical protein
MIFNNNVDVSVSNVPLSRQYSDRKKKNKRRKNVKEILDLSIHERESHLSYV